jgi:hypothetical protein
VLPPPFDGGTLELTEEQEVEERTVDESEESLAEESPGENPSRGGADDFAVNGWPVGDEPSAGGIDPAWGWDAIREDGGEKGLVESETPGDAESVTDDADVSVFDPVIFGCPPGVPECGGVAVGNCWVDVDWLSTPPTSDGRDLLPVDDQNDDQMIVDCGMPGDWGWSWPEGCVFVFDDPGWDRAWSYRTLSETAGSDPVTDQDPPQDDTPISDDTPILMVCSGMPLASELRQIPDEPLPPVSLSYVEVATVSVNADLPAMAPAQAAEEVAASSAVSNPAAPAGTSSLSLRDAAWAGFGLSQNGAELTSATPLGGRRRSR